MSEKIIPFERGNTCNSHASSTKESKHKAAVVPFRKKLNAQLSAITSTPKAFLAYTGEGIIKGATIKIRILDKNYDGLIEEILEKDDLGNVKKISYVIPFLSGDDYHKFGTAVLLYTSPPS